jgi:hypothetical protein
MAVGAAIACSGAASARDINLDEIYIKSSSPFQTRLLLAKLDSWLAVGARLIDRNVAFAGWISGSDLVYVKEAPGGENLIRTHNIVSNKTVTAAVVKGDVMYARVSPGGGFIALKRLIRGNDIVPDGEIVIVTLPGGGQTVISSPNPLLDFTLAGNGTSLLLESGGGIDEYRVQGGTRRTVLGRSACPAAFQQNAPTLAYPSPDNARWVVLSGGGGSYRACLAEGGASREIRGVTSASELCWLGNTAFAYRGGSAGAYSVVVHRLQGNQAGIIGGESFNTSISCSPHAGILSWLRDGAIMLYYPALGRQVATGLEGEEVTFDPAGSRFIALTGHRLFLADLDSLRRKGIELKRAMARVLFIYEELARRPGEMQNEFSSEYVSRKIRLYRELLQSKK